jgi:hypothetical protein
MVTRKEAELRLSYLLNATISFDYAKVLYGIDFNSEKNSELLESLKAIEKRGNSKLNIIDFSKQLVQRESFELALQELNVYSIKDGAAKLGLTAEKLLQITEAMIISGGFSEKRIFLDKNFLIYESFIKSFHKYFEKSSNVLFSNFDSFCNILHEAINESGKYGLVKDEDKIWCKTSEMLNNIDPSESVYFGYEYDPISLEPVSLCYQVWLETKKNISLQPDICSLYTYARFPKLFSAYANNQHEIEKSERYVKLRTLLGNPS